ncbi:MAG: hypothetical protein DKINENOH_05547 [bacterium]|nr:hypothetical protein [bacterium]MCK6562320.1 hypothetical protein [bacterium]
MQSMKIMAGARKNVPARISPELPADMAARNARVLKILLGMLALLVAVTALSVLLLN